jgi:DNA-binding NarL/FixJ family response regulator
LTAERPITVMVVDDHAVVRRGLTTFFEDAPGIRVVADAGDGQAALRLLDRLAVTGPLPDVVLVDVQMPHLDGIATTRSITDLHPGVRVVILTSFGEIERVHTALAAGAVGYVLKDAEPEEITAAVRAAAAGEVYLDPLVARLLTQRLVSPTAGLSALTDRERDVLALVATGRSNRQIAAELVISERTARTHLSNILAKLRLTSRTQAALVAIREGLVPTPAAAPTEAGESHD